MAMKKNSSKESGGVPPKDSPYFNYGPTDINGNPLVDADGMAAFQDKEGARTADNVVVPDAVPESDE